MNKRFQIRVKIDGKLRHKDEIFHEIDLENVWFDGMIRIKDDEGNDVFGYNLDAIEAIEITDPQIPLWQLSQKVKTLEKKLAGIFDALSLPANDPLNKCIEEIEGLIREIRQNI